MSQDMAREDLDDVDEVWVGGDISVDGEEFADALAQVEEFRFAMQAIQSELADLNTGLEREDAIRLVWAKNHTLTLGAVEDTFDTIDDIVDADPMDAGAALLNRQTDLTMEEVGEVLDVMGDLAEKYQPEDA